MNTKPLSSIFVIVIVFAVAALTVSFASRTSAALVADRSFDTIEQLRSQPAGNPSTASGAYGVIEALRLERHMPQLADYRGRGANLGLLGRSSYQDLRHGEWTTGVNSASAYQEFRHGEQTTGVNAAKAILEYRRGEWSGK